MTKREKIIGISAAVLALMLHYYVNPHGVELDPRPGSEIILVKTTTGWMVQDGDTVYQAKEVSVRVDRLD